MKYTKEELVKQALELYKECEEVPAFQGIKFIDYSGDVRTSSDKHYRFNPGSRFHYDQALDTLCNWGRGMGLIYVKGQWADRDFVTPINQNYEIY